MDQGENKRLYDSIEKLGSKFDIFATNTSERLTKIETMFTMFERAQNNLTEKLEDVDDVANKALQSTNSAHKRMDSFEKDAPGRAEFDALKSRTDKHDKIIFWISTLIIGSVILAVLGTVIINK